jgi:hypothetical protein
MTKFDHECPETGYRIRNILLLKLCCSSQQLQQPTLICLYLSALICLYPPYLAVVPVTGTECACKTMLRAPRSTLTLFRFCFSRS